MTHRTGHCSTVRAGTDYVTATLTRHRVTCSTNIQSSKGDVKSSVSTGTFTGDEWTAALR